MSAAPRLLDRGGREDAPARLGHGQGRIGKLRAGAPAEQPHLAAERREGAVEVAAAAEHVVDRLAALVADHLDREDVDPAVREAARHRGEAAGAVREREADAA